VVIKKKKNKAILFVLTKLRNKVRRYLDNNFKNNANIFELIEEGFGPRLNNNIF
jgi:hypothetical protein